MDKKNFIDVLHRYTNSSLEEALSILSLKQHYPYSQLLHSLSARVSKDHSFSEHQLELQQAAVYAADRGVLREIITQVADTAVEESSVAEKIEQSNQVVTSTFASIDLAEEVMQDLQRLNELKHNFEMLFVDVSHVVIKKAGKKTPAEKKVETEQTASIPEPTPAPVKKASGKSKRQRIIELAKAAELNPTPSRVSRTKRKPKNNPDELLDEIASTKKKIGPEGEKQKEQLQIIEQFINAQPSITNSKEKLAQIQQGDLSTIKSGEFGDNIVSETLVEILVKQGKKDKAIEILKKLIWKFPQKKAYFAAQIEDLKK